jgi:hypothetical protein
MGVKMTYEDEQLVKDLLMLIREKNKLDRKIEPIRIQVQKKFEEVDGLTEYFIEQSKRILDE